MRYVLIHIRRKPLVYVAMFLFAAIISLTLCSLHSGNDVALAQYNDIYYKIDVRCTVTNLAGDQSDRLDIPSGIIHLFTGITGYGGSDLAELLEDVQMKGSVEILWNNETYTLTGITSTDIEPKLWPENGCTVFWNENVDSNFWSGDKLECIIPQELQKKMLDAAVFSEYFPVHISAAYSREKEYDGDLKILGTYQGSNDRIIYCPWNTYIYILNSIGRSETADAIFATLGNNSNLQLLRETASLYFAEPNPRNIGLETDGKYYYALDINDSQLVQAKTNLENSMTVNRIAAMLVFALSAVAGSFVGVLIIRSRKKEIILMRTIGAPSWRIFLGFVMEQLIFVMIGAIAGGAKFEWNPVGWLVIFVCVYCIGLSVALFIMLRKKLLTTMKEDE